MHVPKLAGHNFVVKALGASSHRCDAEALVVRRVVMISDYNTDVDSSKQGRTTGVTADSSHSSAKVGGNEPLEGPDSMPRVTRLMSYRPGPVTPFFQ